MEPQRNMVHALEIFLYQALILHQLTVFLYIGQRMVIKVLRNAIYSLDRIYRSLLLTESSMLGVFREFLIDRFFTYADLF